MITRITVDGFKSLADFEMELGQVNVLIGANGSGKTNILEAIGLLSAAARGTVDNEALARRGVRLSGLGRYLTRLSQIETGATVNMKAEWERDGRVATYEVALEPPSNANVWRYKQERGTENGESILDRAAAANGALDPEAGWGALKAVQLPPGSAARVLLAWLDPYGIYAATTPGLRGTVPDLQQREPLGLSGGGLPEAVWVLKQLSDTKAEPFPFVPPQVAIDDMAKHPSHVEQVLADALALADWAAGMGVEERSAELLAAGVAWRLQHLHPGPALRPRTPRGAQRLTLRLRHGR